MGTTNFVVVKVPRYSENSECSLYLLLALTERFIVSFHASLLAVRKTERMFVDIKDPGETWSSMNHVIVSKVFFFFFGLKNELGILDFSLLKKIL